MNKTNIVFHYAVVRFMPFIETREFANVGVVLTEPKTGKLIYKLAPKRFGRVTQFFDDLDGQLYKNAIDVFANELDRIQEYFIDYGLFGKAFVDRFNEVIRRRESIVHFSELGRIAGDDANVVLETLYKRFVAREFVTKYYREQQMVKVLKDKLIEHIPVKFVEKNITVGPYDIKLPLVHKSDDQYRIIKPLALDQQTPLKAMVHGETWVNNIKRLVKHEVIQPEHALFTVEKPNSRKDFTQVYDDVVGEINEIGVEALEFNNLEPVIQFAKNKLITPIQPH